MSVFYEVARSAPPNIDQNYSQQEDDWQSVQYLLRLLVASRHSWEVITPENRVAHQSVHNRYDIHTLLGWITNLSTSFQLLLSFDLTLSSDLKNRIQDYLDFVNPSEVRLMSRFDDSYFLQGNDLIEAILKHHGLTFEQVIDPQLKPDTELK